MSTVPYRLRLIARLQDEGHSLAGIARLLEQWEQGRILDAVVGIETELDSLLGDAHAIVLGPAGLLARFPDGALSGHDMQRAAALGLVAPTEDGRLRLADRRFLETGASLAELGIPAQVILDEWEALIAHTDDIAERFIATFEAHLAPNDWRQDLDADQARELATTLARLRATARQVLVAALDASVARIGRERLAELIDR